MNAPWKSQCDCTGGYYYPNWYQPWEYKEPWWKQVYYGTDTFKAHPETTTWKAPSSVCGSDSATADPNSTIYTTVHNPVVGGSDYWDNINQTWSNTPNVSNSSTSVDSPWNQLFTLADRYEKIQKEIDKLKESK